MRSFSCRAFRASGISASPRSARLIRRADRRAPRLTSRAAWTAAAVLAAAACGSAVPTSGKAGAPARPAAATSAAPAGPGQAAPTPTARPPSRQAPSQPGQPSCDPRQIGPIAASFVSATDGYLLGITLADCAATGASKIVARKTADGGLHWTALPAPPAPWGGVAPDGTGRVPADGVTSVLFADARDGWAYGPGLWATHDGGASWHVVATGGRVVQHMAAAGGQVIASFDSCDPSDAGCGGAHPVGVEYSPAGDDAWRLVPGAAGGGAVAARAGTGYAVSAGTGQVGTDEELLAGPADGSARWGGRPLPCQQGAIALAAVTVTRLLLACALLGAHPATTYLYSSGDAGAHWTRFAVLGLYDGASSIEQAPDGSVLVAGIYNGVELSRDGGRTWTSPAAVDGSGSVQGGGALTADLVTSEEGYVIGWLGPLWITRDAGRTWTQVPVR
jgi:hypothetical protein